MRKKKGRFLYEHLFNLRIDGNSNQRVFKDTVENDLAGFAVHHAEVHGVGVERGHFGFDGYNLGDALFRRGTMATAELRFTIRFGDLARMAS